MTTSALRRQIAGLAEALCVAADESWPGFREQARVDAIEATHCLGVTLSFVDRQSLPAKCSVAAYYDKARKHVTVARALSVRRQSFSALHEGAHHLLTTMVGLNSGVAEVLYAMTDGGKELEEDVAEAFAARLLLPEREVSPLIGPEGIDAAAIVRLFGGTAASREACAVWAADRLPAPGYVIVAETDGTVRFAARAGDSFPIARDTPQPRTPLARAGQIGRARSVDSLYYRSGVQTDPLQIDAILDADLVLAVAMTDSAPWAKLNLPVVPQPRAVAGYCENCGADFESHESACPTCDQRRCPRCSRCGCETGASRGERTCTECFQALPARMFPGPESICNQH